MTPILREAAMPGAGAVDISEGFRRVEGDLVGADADNRPVARVQPRDVEMRAPAEDGELRRNA